MNGMCHWKYQMLDDLKKKRKEEADQAQLAVAKRQKTEHGRTADENCDVPPGTRLQIAPVQASLGDTTVGSPLVKQDCTPHDDMDEESIDKDIGYSVKDGNLLKDGVLVATGKLFDEVDFIEEAVIGE